MFWMQFLFFYFNMNFNFLLNINGLFIILIVFGSLFHKLYFLEFWYFYIQGLNWIVEYADLRMFWCCKNEFQNWTECKITVIYFRQVLEVMNKFMNKAYYIL